MLVSISTSTFSVSWVSVKDLFILVLFDYSLHMRVLILKRKLIFAKRSRGFQRNVVALAAELKDVRIRFASQQESCARETLTRQAVERKARSMEGEIFRLHQSLQEKDDQLQASASTTKQFLKELDDLRLQLSGTQETVNASSASAQSAHLQYLALAKGLDEKNIMLKEQEDCVNRLAEQLNHLQMDLQAREVSQKQLKDEILRIEKDIMQEVAVAGASKDCELRKILDEVSPKKD
ncbi:hypothetical protein F0562_000710 [Nyssa sinensis]|uniref:Uncharacterized protein n=1 Tax=Nyssa sinensis TaxID=561372 RepID=A0A5J5C2B4_9ASTE|nr:hypothetical protein F0562_000710 [Nyssa sinensis]